MNKNDQVEKWMERFKSAWLGKDIDAVLNLLSDDVEYWETPFHKMGKGIELRTAWEEILPLENMKLTYEIFVADLEKNKYGIKWNFAHSAGESGGAYLIELDKEGFCKYFYHVARPRE